MSRKIAPRFTQAQSGMVRVGLKDVLEGEYDAPARRAAENALEELDRAEIAWKEGRGESHTHRPTPGTRNRISSEHVEYLCRDCNAYYIRVETR